MRSLAGILLEAGHRLLLADRCFQETDFVPAESADRRDVLQSHRDAVRIIPWPQCPEALAIAGCIRSPAVPPDAAPVPALRNRGCPVLTPAAALNRLFSDRRQVSVAGTHGKSTTTALLGWILDDSRSSAGWFFGADLRGDAVTGDHPARPSSGGRYGTGPFAVIESCEYADSFLQLDPAHIVLTGIDGDHFDWFRQSAHEDAAFGRFLDRRSEDGLLVLRQDCERSCRIARGRRRTITWTTSGHRAADWSGSVIAAAKGRTTVRIRRAGRRVTDVVVPLTGRHNVSNVTAAVTMACLLGTSIQQIRCRAEHFPGLKRRLEPRGQLGQTVLIDDYAHHPTAVSCVLQTVRQQYPDRRLRAVFEPHQALRLRRCWKPFIAALQQADEVLVLPVFPARERTPPAQCGALSDRLALEIRAAGTSATYHNALHSAAAAIQQTAHHRDVVITMGAGTVHQIHDEVHRRFQRHPAA